MHLLPCLLTFSTICLSRFSIAYPDPSKQDGHGVYEPFADNDDVHSPGIRRAIFNDPPTYLTKRKAAFYARSLRRRTGDQKSTDVFSAEQQLAVGTSAPESVAGSRKRKRKKPEPEACKECGKEVKNVSEHRKAVHGYIAPFPCQVPNCGHSYEFQGRLDNHMKNYNHQQNRDEWPCNTDDCTLVLSSKASRDNHIKVQHLGETGGFKCQYCGKSDSHSSNNKRHEKNCAENPKNKSSLQTVPEYYE